MGGAASHHDGFEIVEKDDDPAVCTDDEYEFVEAPPLKCPVVLPLPCRETIDDQGDTKKTTIVVQSTPPQVAVAAPPPPQVAVAAPPSVAGDRGDQAAAFPPAGSEAFITGRDDQGRDTKNMIVQSTPPPQVFVAPTRSSPQKQAPAVKEEEKSAASPFSFYDFSAAAPLPPGLPHDLMIDMRGVVKAAAAPVASRAVAARLWAPVAFGDDEVTDEEDDDDDDYDCSYDACYDFADFGRSRRVKPSSGRRGRTKKATTRGRPRGEERSSHIAGKW